MKYKITYLFCYVIYLTTGCVNRSNIDNNSSINHTDVVIVINKDKYKIDYQALPYYEPNKFFYYDDYLIRNQYVLKNSDQADTLKIKTNLKLLPLDLFYHYVTYNYHFKPGDTLIFNFYQGYPEVKAKNRKDDFYNLNYSLAYKKRFNQQLSRYSTPLPNSNQNNVKNGGLDIIQKKFDDQNHFIDSLKNKQLLSVDLAGAYKRQNMFNYYLYQYFLPQKLKDNTDKIDLNKLINDEQFYYNDYFHQALIWKYLWQHPNISKIKRNAGISLNYMQAFDAVNHDFTNPKIKAAMLFYCLQMIYEQDSHSNFEKYFNKFKKLETNTYYIEQLNKNNLYSKEKLKKKTILVNFQNEEIEFEDLIKKFKGNLIYVDLWASWCVPCRAAMPASVEMRNLFKDKPVQFLYLSLDKKYTDWQIALKDEKLTEYKNSYLLKDVKNAQLLKALGIVTIPRYLIYNKKGQLINQNAPGPNSNKLRDLLNKSLSE